jgi:glycogen(starch) synthase
MKIALLSFEYPVETGFGGIGTYAWYQARALAKLGHDVHVLAGATATTSLRTTEHDGVTVHRIRVDGMLPRLFRRFGQAGLWWTENRLQNGWSMYRGLSALMERQAFDVVEMPECGAEGWLVNRLVRIPSIVRFHSPARLIMGGYDVRPSDITLCSALEQFAMNGARAFTSCSRFLADEVKTKLGIKTAVEVIPNGIDVELFDSEEQVDIRQRFNLPSGRPIILFTGRMEPRKGIELCPAIAENILARHNVAFVFAGRDLFGYMANTLLPRVQARPLKGSLHYVGELDLATVRSCVRQADIFLLPSLWENCPYSCLEAMAAGRAIVASDQGGIPELIQHERTGLLARCGDANAFIAQLDRLIEDEALRLRLGSAARASIETSFTDVRIAETSVDYYRNTLHIGS